MTRKILKRLIREAIREEIEQPGARISAVLPPNTPAKPMNVGREAVAVSNFTTHKLEVSVKQVSSGAIFIDIRDA